MSKAERYRDKLEDLIREAESEGVTLYIDNADGDEVLNFFDDVADEQADVDPDLWRF